MPSCYANLIRWLIELEFSQPSSNGLGIQAVSGTDFCEITLQFPSDTDSKWVGQLSPIIKIVFSVLDGVGSSHKNSLLRALPLPTFRQQEHRIAL
ncbi:hypothetical protein CsSME_00007195 [Camellia sinensis var. sinensis]